MLPDHVVRSVVLQVEGDDVFGIGGNQDVFARARHRARESLRVETLLINRRGSKIRGQLIGEGRSASGGDQFQIEPRGFGRTVTGFCG